MSLTLPELRRILVRAARSLHARGWVANHDGNLSARLPAGRILVTPTAMGKGDIGEADLVEIDLGGRRIGGARRPPSEVGLHLAFYRARPDIGAIVHAHPPAAVAHAVVGIDIPVAMMAEPVVSLGPAIPRVAHAPPGSADLHAAVEEAARRASCLLLDRHGPLVGGADLEQAMLRLELVEHLARIHERARALGEVRLLPEAEIQALLAAHRKAGLAPPEAR